MDYKEGKSKLPEGKTSAEGCIYCDPELSQLVEKHHAVAMKRRVNHQGGGAGGRGGGRRAG